LTPSRLGGFSFYFSDPLVHEIAMVLRFLVGIIEVRHQEILPSPGFTKSPARRLVFAWLPMAAAPLVPVGHIR